MAVGGYDVVPVGAAVCGSAGADVVGGRVESGWPRDAAMFAKTATIAVALGHVSGIFNRRRRGPWKMRAGT